MAWDDLKSPGDLIMSSEYNDKVGYIKGHRQEHGMEGIDPLKHDLLAGLNQGDYIHLTHDEYEILANLGNLYLKRDGTNSFIGTKLDFLNNIHLYTHMNSFDFSADDEQGTKERLFNLIGGFKFRLHADSGQGMLESRCTAGEAVITTTSEGTVLRISSLSGLVLGNSDGDINFKHMGPGKGDFVFQLNTNDGSTKLRIKDINNNDVIYWDSKGNSKTSGRIVSSAESVDDIPQIAVESNQDAVIGAIRATSGHFIRIGAGTLATRLEVDENAQALEFARISHWDDPLGGTVLMTLDVDDADLWVYGDLKVKHLEGGIILFNVDKSTGDITSLGSMDAISYKVNGVLGVDGVFTTADGKAVTVTKGIITSIE